MTYEIIASPRFKRDIKKLQKKYPSLKHEYFALVAGLETNPMQGVPLGKNCFKIRIAISSKGRGKSGGGRVITHIIVENDIVYLLAIYDKAEKDSISEAELIELLSQSNTF